MSNSEADDKLTAEVNAGLANFATKVDSMITSADQCQKPKRKDQWSFLYRPSRPDAAQKQKRSLSGQLPLIDDLPIDHLEKKKKR